MVFLITALVVLAAAGGTLYGWLRRSLPKVRGKVVLSGLQHLVNVYRDERGVPHIEARTSHDLYKAQGFVTAQDRLWQMDMMRRLASGRLSEILGAGLIKSDKFFRTFQLRRSAIKSRAGYSSEALAKIEQYCAGVNEYIEQAKRSKRLTVEFTLLGYQPELWTVEDVLTVGKLMSFNLGQNYKYEVYQYELRKTVEEELFRLLRPRYPADGYVSIQAGEHAGEIPARGESTELPDSTQVQVDGILEMIAGTGESAIGSNGWVVAGTRTHSGKPLLANDPHIELTNPATWYQTHLQLQGLDDEQEHLNVIGVTVPGIPGVLLGHNEHCAWGVTNSQGDAQDLYIERRNPDNPRQFAYDGQWEDANVYEEVIKVKGGKEVRFDVVETRHGPVISDSLELTKGTEAEVLSVCWSANQPTTELEALFRFNKARNWQEFREALRLFQAPALNFIFASVDGTIAMKTVGSLPMRMAGDGTFPMPGWDSRTGWAGMIPFDELPEIVNPESGFIATCNNKIIDDFYPHLITKTWNMPYRGNRIAEVLGASEDLTVDDMRALQVDVENLQARKLLPILLPCLQSLSWSGNERMALELLQQWDGCDKADSGGSLVFQLLWEQIGIHLFASKVGEKLFPQMLDKGIQTDEYLVAAADGNPNRWVLEAGGLETLVADSFRAAVVKAESLLGTNVKAWQWGSYHHLQPQHPIGAQVKALGWLMNPKRYAASGSFVTLGMMAFNRKTGAVVEGAPWRMVCDLADLPGNSWDVLIPGQIGHFLSRWYQDQLKPHVQGKLSPMQFEQQAYHNHVHLQLVPAQ